MENNPYNKNRYLKQTNKIVKIIPIQLEESNFPFKLNSHSISFLKLKFSFGLIKREINCRNIY